MGGFVIANSDCSVLYTDDSGADQSSTGTTGTPVGLTDNANPTGARVGYYDGSTSYMNGGTQLINTDIDFSFSMWFTKDTGAGTDYLFADGISSGNHAGWRVFATATLLTFNVRGGGATGTTTATITTDTWYHVAGTYNATTDVFNLYLNGEFVSTDTNAHDTDGSQNEFFVGANTDGNDEWWTGNISDAAVFKRELSPEEIKHIYQKTYRS